MSNKNSLAREANSSDSQYETYNSLQGEVPIVNEGYDPNINETRNSTSIDLNSQIGTRPTAESTRRIREVQNQQYDSNSVSRISLSTQIFGTGSTDNSPHRHHEIPNPNLNGSFCKFCRVHSKTIVIVLFIVLILGIDFTFLQIFYRFSSFYDAP